MYNRYIYNTPAIILASVMLVTPFSVTSAETNPSPTTAASQTESTSDAIGATSNQTDDQLNNDDSKSPKGTDTKMDEKASSEASNGEDGPTITTSYDFNNKDGSTADAVGKFLWGFTPSSGLGIGMWSYHVFYDEPFGPDVNWHQDILAINYKSFYVATVNNTYFNRSYTAGIRRDFFRYQDGPINVEIGYNLGVISGYKDGQGMWLSNYSPVIPFAQAFVDITIYHVGVEFAVVPPLEVLSIAGRVSF